MYNLKSMYFQGDYANVLPYVIPMEINNKCRLSAFSSVAYNLLSCIFFKSKYSDTIFKLGCYH